ncbi:MAG: HAMP domain-containing histidine kinase [Desulfuromonadales bacterium]|nr:HAMP domain-containing histidine kinase [Desulfuromonadales bacterium]
MRTDHGFMQAPTSDTWFAPAERAHQMQLQKMAAYCLQNPITQIILDSVEGYVLVLNEQRQILAANPETLRTLNISMAEAIVGMRPGEAFHCDHSNDAPGGCGTSKPCSTCGAAIAIMASQKYNQPTSKECLMSVERNNRLEAHEFTVRASPLKLDSHNLTIFVLQDINAEKRRDVLEMLFLHDLSNVITGLQGWSELLLRQPQDATLIAQNIVSLSTRMTHEIQTQRLIMQAEKGEQNVYLEKLRVGEILDTMKAFFKGYPADRVHRLFIAPEGSSTLLTTNPALLTRVLVNMVKNALEATTTGDQVRIWYEIRGGRHCFVVHNPGKIPEEIALQIFKRSFSTKAEPGRGLGTYSMKLFGEQVLGGEVGFTTSEEEGTSFFITLPATDA